MHFETLPGYEEGLPPIGVRVADAIQLSSQGGRIILGAAVKTDIGIGPHGTLQSEISATKNHRPNEGKFVIGPFVYDVNSRKPFVPNGLAVWELPLDQA